ncbi:MAG: hypothetical protein IIC49_02580, partial [Planctomycetes bacterium]|nr:hypothetical protein [Planctomycetota bacterium]
LNRHGLTPFGWYRLALSAVLAGLIAGGVVSIGDSADQQPERPVEAIDTP